eukprot:4097894-Ditylum_brightwellii.AAC.1
MTAAEAETIHQNHRLQLAVYNKFLNTDKALKNLLLHTIDDQYTKAFLNTCIATTPVASTTSAASYVQNQTAEALAQLATVTEEDCSTVSNLTDTNSNLMEQ